MVKSLKKSKNKGLSFKNKFKLSLSNFMERKWRNLLIAVATSIGFVGVLISFGLGNALISMIDENTNGGKLPSQVQIALNSSVAGRGFLNQEDKNYITDTIGKENIKYLESPFGMTMSKMSIDGHEVDFSQALPSYAQVVSLYEDTSISVTSNEKEKVLAGSLYTDVNEQGLTIPMSLLKNWNEQTGNNLTASDVIGKKVSATIVENAAEGSKTSQFQTHIVRVINDEDDMEDSNSFMPAYQMETILKEAGFTKTVSYFILELKDPSRTKTVTEELQKNKKYTVLSQQAVLDIVITFIRVIQGLLIVLSSQAIVVAAVMIGIIIYINIMQRSKEIGVMKAVGYQNRDVKGIFIYEALWIVGIALFIAFIIAQGIGSLANVIVHHFYPSISKVFELNLLSILGTLVFAFFLGYGSAFFPARKISKMDPVESLRYE
ncbi:FtsX-like permease family protein [Streptococcus infantis]|uniref:ABC transporter permease n=1 Tax=Streptococcus TaxID=1301 RepID=UPI001F3762C6|nr:ABC transporter permease [Streptococcus infantis]UJD03151.1 FtsX-like permease family protein [Streptococcus infantis]